MAEVMRLKLAISRGRRQGSAPLQPMPSSGMRHATTHTTGTDDIGGLDRVIEMVIEVYFEQVRCAER